MNRRRYIFKIRAKPIPSSWFSPLLCLSTKFPDKIGFGGQARVPTKRIRQSYLSNHLPIVETHWARWMRRANLLACAARISSPAKFLNGRRFAPPKTYQFMTRMARGFQSSRQSIWSCFIKSQQISFRVGRKASLVQKWLFRFRRIEKRGLFRHYWRANQFQLFHRRTFRLCIFRGKRGNYLK